VWSESLDRWEFPPVIPSYVLDAAQICEAPVIRKALTPALSQREREQEESPLLQNGGRVRVRGNFQ